MDSDVWNQLSRDWQRRGDTAHAPAALVWR